MKYTIVVSAKYIKQVDRLLDMLNRWCRAAESNEVLSYKKGPDSDKDKNDE